ncbi:MAG TPA: envelope stress response membrane protein PspB [Solimonas sp.]|nr:envelope stress response membrane protein PspB [Solimonas sp.]
MEDLVPLVAVMSPFVFVIALVGMILHFKERRRMHAVAPLIEAQAGSADLARIAERMEKRIDALERILDTEAPGWRKKYEHS